MEDFDIISLCLRNKISGRRINTVQDVLKHLERDPQNPKIHKCRRCNKTFTRHYALNKHKQNFHKGVDEKDMLILTENKGPNAYSCIICKASFDNFFGLLQHNMGHSDVKNVCDVCEKHFDSQYDLKVHIRTHTKEKPYMCERCGKTFAVSYRLKEHQKLHEDVVQVKKRFTCPDCGKDYAESYFKMHRLNFCNT